MYSQPGNVNIKPGQTYSATFEEKANVLGPDKCAYQHSSFVFQYVGNKTGKIYEFYFADGRRSFRSPTSYIPAKAMNINSHFDGTEIAAASTASEKVVQFSPFKVSDLHITYNPK